VDTLNSQLAAGTVADSNGNIAPAKDVTDADGNITTPGQETQYETNLAPYIQSFGRLSVNLVSGDDISAVDSLSKQASDEEDYVINNLLGGKLASDGTYSINPEASPDTCEPFMAHLLKTDPTTYAKYCGREAYPYPIDHLYGPVEDEVTFSANGTAATHGGYTIPWSQNAVAGMTTVYPTNYFSNEGFLYGSAYWDNNSAIADWAGNNPNGYGGIDPPASATGFSPGCITRWIRSVPLTNGNDGVDRAGLNPIQYPFNTCGVVLNFERNFDIY
jgi:hypothetical protein